MREEQNKGMLIGPHAWLVDLHKQDVHQRVPNKQQNIPTSLLQLLQMATPPAHASSPMRGLPATEVTLPSQASGCCQLMLLPLGNQTLQCICTAHKGPSRKERKKEKNREKANYRRMARALALVNPSPSNKKRHKTRHRPHNPQATLPLEDPKPLQPNTKPKGTLQPRQQTKRPTTTQAASAKAYQHVNPENPKLELPRAHLRPPAMEELTPLSLVDFKGQNFEGNTGTGSRPGGSSGLGVSSAYSLGTIRTKSVGRNGRAPWNKESAKEAGQISPWQIETLKA